MQTILHIFRKELLDTLRDRRTLIMMILFPMVLFPLILGLTMTITQNQRTKEATRTLKIGLIGTEVAPGLVSALESRDDFTLIPGLGLADTARHIRTDSLDLVLWVSPDYAAALDSLGSAQLRIYHQSTDDDKVKNRLKEAIEAYEGELLQARLNQLDIRGETIDPFAIDDTHNVASKQEIIGKLVGGFLPYIFILFCFLGTYYPAVDLFTGEKERGTIETLLTVPVSRQQILIGKMLVVAASGLISALVGMLGLRLSIALVELPPAFAQVLTSLAQPSAILLILGMIVPLAVFFAGVLIPLAIYARNFKEAQSLIAPLNILVIIPAALAMLPGLEFNLWTGLVPILNVALISKEIVAGTAEVWGILLVFGSLVVLALAS
ncbi:MAG: ABC transporter permease, partial [Bacteroidetes bacterium]